MNLDPAVQLAALQERAARARAAHGKGYRAWLFRAIGILLVVLRDLAFGQLTLRAMSLVYTTLLSIVPLLALSFSVLKAFGVHNQIEPALQRFLEPLGERGVEVAEQIIAFIGNMNVGVLGSVGLALLLYTAISLVQKIEMSFNYIWHVDEPRSFGARFSSYLSVLLVGPLLVFSALGITAAVTSFGIVRDLMAIEPLGRIAVQLGKLLPYAIIVGLFTFIYLFIPNTRVGFAAALGGALVGGIAWQTAGWGFATFVASSAQYAAIYSGFAILILFMIWIYVSWLIVLVGASVGFYLQHGEYVIAKAGEPALSGRLRERLALSIMQRIGACHLAGGAPLTLEVLTRALRLPAYAIRNSLDLLTAHALLMPTASDPVAWLPAKDLSAISAWDVVDAVRADGEALAIGPDRLAATGPLDALLAAHESASAAQLGAATLRDLAAGTPLEPSPPRSSIGPEPPPSTVESARAPTARAPGVSRAKPE